MRFAAAAASFCFLFFNCLWSSPIEIRRLSWFRVDKAAVGLLGFHSDPATLFAVTQALIHNTFSHQSSKFVATIKVHFSTNSSLTVIYVATFRCPSCLAKPSSSRLRSLSFSPSSSTPSTPTRRSSCESLSPTPQMLSTRSATRPCPTQASWTPKRTSVSTSFPTRRTRPLPSRTLVSV